MYEGNGGWLSAFCNGLSASQQHDSELFVSSVTSTD